VSTLTKQQSFKSLVHSTLDDPEKAELLTKPLDAE